MRVRDLQDLPKGQLRTQVQMALGPDTPKPKGHDRDKLEDAMDFDLRLFKFPPFFRNHRFAQSIGRQWHFDFAWPQFKVALECEGLVVRRIAGQMVCMGRHANVAGYREDCLKYANAVLLGWSVLRFEKDQIKSGLARDMALKLLTAKGWNPTGANQAKD